MADIAGTTGADTLKGTPGNDKILGLAGNDLIIGTLGNDVIDGGAGNDTIDFSEIDETLLLANTGEYIGTPSNNPIATAQLSNIETIVANPNRYNGIVSVPNFPSSDTDRIDADLAKNRLTVYDDTNNSSKTFTVKNFNYITILGNSASNRLAGNDGDNNIFGDGNDTIIGSKGNDILNGGTLDYSNLGRPVKFLLSQEGSNESIVNKGNFGEDKVGAGSLINVIIGATNQENTIDASNIRGGLPIDVNLANNSLNVNIPPNIGSRYVEVRNFVNVIGTKSGDTIFGANKNGKLTGGGGNDTITGGNKNDIIAGTDSTARGVGEVDTLTGGGGKDKFILGDKNGAYYLGKGNDDYALITDFNIFKDSIGIGSMKDYSFTIEGKNTIDLFHGKDINNRDLIAKIQFADIGNLFSKGASWNSKSSSIVGESSPNIDAIVSKMDIISDSNYTIDTRF